VIILGDGAVGKTSIAMRHTEDSFSNMYKQTIGLDFFLKRLVLPGTGSTLSLLVGMELQHQILTPNL
jgi:GTPase SAR1 family protein